jgi:hypothetical protein
MTAPTNAAEITRTLGQLSLDLWKCIEQLEQADLDATEKKHDADLAYSKAFLTATGSVDQRKHTAFVETEELRFAAEVADALVRNLVRRMKGLERRVEVGRSTSSWHKAELSLTQAGVEH